MTTQAGDLDLKIPKVRPGRSSLAWTTPSSPTSAWMPPTARPG
ncbi:hypothetical protein ACIQB5_44820 [Streptomyces sp. NPDC088560]